ncbi:hypothetical protein [Vibrio crassostreae]|uniref:hypothetical protein n=1 Tax=Vibrio crassostreae TaxID=246167 RepID=UPI001B30C4DF|nr:hypothetical protein [Vibrio crassostreae]
MSNLKLTFQNKKHFTALRKVYEHHLISEFKFDSFPRHTIDKFFAEFCGYGDTNYLMASLRGNQTFTPPVQTPQLFASAIELTNLSMDEAFVSLVGRYKSHMADAYGMSFKEKKLQAKFLSLLESADVEQAKSDMASQWLGVQMYIVALEMNLNAQTSMAWRGEAHSLDLSGSSRMKYIPVSLKPSAEVVSEVSQLLFSYSPKLEAELAKVNTYADLFEVIESWTQTVGVRAYIEDEDFFADMGDLEQQLFLTNKASFSHSHRDFNMWTIEINAGDGFVEETDIKAAMRQINSVWRDVDMRGHYNTDNLADEVIGLELLSGKHNKLNLDYSSSYRGKMKLSTH